MTTKTLLLVAALLAGVFILVAGITTIWGIGQYNTAASLRNQYDAKLKANEAIFDNTWKKITQSVQVTDMQKAALKDIFTSYAQARTGEGANSGAALMKWTQEAIPNVDVSVYRNLQNIITGARDEWTANQVALVDIAREYNLMLVRFPSNLILGTLGFKHLDPKVITSTKTDEAFKTGRDDDVSLTPSGK